MGTGVHQFCWISANDIQPECDLRRCGWRLSDCNGFDATELGCAVAIADHAGMMPAQWIALAGLPLQSGRRRFLLYGVANGPERARLLALGFGDVIAAGIGIEEVEARALRILQEADSLPHRRDLGRLLLDLQARDALVDGRRAGLHPREFALLWRLAEMPGSSVSKAQLMRDVWQIAFVPETNSLAVHVFRLRAKLAIAGLSGVVQTMPDGGYALVLSRSPGKIAEQPLMPARQARTRLSTPAGRFG